MKIFDKKVSDGMQAVDKVLWKRVYQRVGIYWKAFIIAIVFTLVSSLTQPAMAYLMKPLLDEGFLGAEKFFLWAMPVAVITLMFVRGFSAFVGSYLMAWIANKTLLGIRKEMFDKLLALPDPVFQQGDTGRLLNRFTVDAGNVTSQAAQVVSVAFREVFVIIALLLMLLYLSWQLTLVIFLIFPLSILVGRYFSRRLRLINRRTIDINADLTSVVKENIAGQREVKLFNGYQRECKRFEKVNRSLRRYAMRGASAEALMSPLTQWVISFSVAAVIGMALYQSQEGNLTVGSFIAYISALGQIFDPVKRLTNLAGKVQKMMMSAESVFALIDSDEEIDKGQLKCKVKPASMFEFKDVHFSYNPDQEDVLKGIDFKVQAGETIALVGRSGGGKTTLVNLLPRFVEPTQGQVLIDGIPLNQYSLKSLRKNLSLVSQNVVLFEASIADNIRYGHYEDVSDQRLEEILKAANLWVFVQTLPEGMHTMVGENGAWLSGGQRQRLAIARALLKNTPILILDEATSALDNESERQVQDSLNQLMKGRTTFVIAHRLSTIKNADRIFVLDHGTIVEEGNHDELLKNGGLYQSLYQMQFQQTE